MRPILLCLMMLYSTGCSPKPPAISGDIGCVWAKRIDVTEFQVEAMKKEPGTWRPLAVQIKDNNDERLKRCS